jgi:hypothetical protein
MECHCARCGKPVLELLAMSDIMGMVRNAWNASNSNETIRVKIHQFHVLILGIVNNLLQTTDKASFEATFKSLKKNINIYKNWLSANTKIKVQDLKDADIMPAAVVNKNE